MKPKCTSLFSLVLMLGIIALHVARLTAGAQVIAQSITEFSGIQGSNGWFNGYRNYTLSGETEDYDVTNHFIAYTGGVGRGVWNGTNQQWTGTQWDLNTAAAPPFTFQGAQNIYPNGTNSAPNQEH